MAKISYDSGATYSDDFSRPEYYDMNYRLPQLGLAGQIVQKMFPDPFSSGSYNNYMKQLTSNVSSPPPMQPYLAAARPVVDPVVAPFAAATPPASMMPANNFNLAQFSPGPNAQQTALAPPKMVQPEGMAHGGEVEAALHAVRHHLAGGGFLSDLFSGPDYLSTGEVASPTNWGDPELASDFFKADRALRLAREVQAPMTSSVPDRAPLTAPRPVKIEGTELAPPPAQAFTPVSVEDLAPAPVSIPFAAPERGVPVMGANIVPASFAAQPIAYSPEAPAAPAAAAIDKLTARAPQDVEPTASNAQILAAIRANESRNNPRAQNPSSSAGGLYQFLNSTWGNTLRRMDPERFGAYNDRQLRGLKTDPNAVDIQHAAANYHLTNDIAPRLSKAGVPLTPGSAYLSWFQGPGGAVRAYTAPDDATVAQVFPKTVSANANMRFNGKPYAQWTMSDLRQWADTAMAKRMGRAEGGEIHGDEQMNHDDIVAHALHRLRRHFNGLDGSYVDPMGGVAYGDNSFTPTEEIVPVRERERQALTPSSMARAWTPPEEQSAIDGRRAGSPSPENFTRGLQTVGEGIVPAGEIVGDYLKSRFYDPGQQFAPNADTSPRTFRSAVAGLKGPEETTKDMVPNQFLQDVGSAGSAMAHGFYEDPAGFIGGMFPPVAAAQSGAGISDLSEAVAKAKAVGDTETARKLSAASTFLAAAPFIPGAKMAADEAIAAAKATARKVMSPTAEVAGSALPQLPASVRALEIARGEAAPSDVVSGMTGAFAPKEAPIRGQTGLEIKAMQERALNPEEMDKLTAMRAQSPEFAQASRFMLPEELKGVIANPRQIEPMMRLLEVIPQAEQMSSLAKAGAPKQGWYRGSTQALMDVFGPQDAPRFSALLAATSPQTSVESNLLNTLNIWKNWEAAGRPTDPAAIKRVMGASVQGGKGEDSILEAWVNNSIRALTTPDPRAITLSGPKVNSFFRNLADDVYRVTNDAWISNATNIDQGLLRVSPTAQQLAAGNPGYSPGYLALSARQREGGQMARMLPSEAQETIWSVAMPLMEGATKAGMHPREFLQRGLLTPDLIRGTPDFSSLLRNDPRYANIIQQMGRGEQLEKMQPFNFPRQLPEMTASDVANLEKTADTLGNLRERRQRESRSLFPGYTPEQEKTFAHVTTSGIPGRGTGVAEDLIDAPAGSRANFSSRVSNVFQDPTGMDILHKNLGLNPVSTVPSTEVWRPGMEGPVGGMGTSLAHATEYRPPLEVGRGYTASVEAPVTLNKSGQKIVDPAVERALEVASTLRGAMTAQHGTPHHALIGDPKGAGTAFTFPKKVDAGDQQARFGMLGALNTEPLAIADTGRTLSAFPWGKMEPFTQADRDWMKGLAGATEAIPVTNIAGKKSYVDLSSEFAQPEGSRAVAKRLTSSLNKLTPEEFGRLDNVELRRAAGDLHDMYASQNAKGNRVRPDFLNMLSIMRDKGLKGLQAAYRKKEFLPVLAALGLGDQMLNGTSASGGQ